MKSKSSVKSSVKILSLMTANMFITIPELAEKIGITTRTIEKQIKKMQIENKLERIGPEYQKTIINVGEMSEKCRRNLRGKIR
jgi:transcriptional antiterminator